MGPLNRLLLLACALFEASAAPVASPPTRTVKYYTDASDYAAGGEPLGAFNETAYYTGTFEPSSPFWPPFGGRFDEKILRPFVSMSRAAYCPTQALADWTCDSCEPKATDVQVYTDDKTDTQAYVAYFKGSIFQRSKVVVAFRGSQSMRNWLYNLQVARLAPYPHCVGCSVHYGFYESWKSVQDSITQQVRGLLANDTRAEVYITGHSLGLHNESTPSVPIAGVYTFGEPRVGNYAFQQYYAQGTFESWRLTHWKDPVPHLPPSLFGYRHIGHEVFYNNDSSAFRVCDNSGEDAACSNSVAWDDVLFVSDHMQYMGEHITGCNS